MSRWFPVFLVTAPRSSAFLIIGILMGVIMSDAPAQQGKFFAKKAYAPEPLPVYETIRDRLPAPIFDEKPLYTACCEKAWKLAFRSFRKPYEGSPFVSNYIDEAFNQSLFLWDTSFMTMFLNHALPLVPGIQSLDNFYCTQLPDGEIVREVNERTGIPHRASRPGTPDSLNHPILAWAECESFRVTGDLKRLKLVYPSLVPYYRSYAKIRHPESGFIRTSWASMDNSTRNKGLRCGIDTTCEVVLFARNLAFIAARLGRADEAEIFEQEAAALSAHINLKLWDDEVGFYFDEAADGGRHRVKTIAAFWSLLAGVARGERAQRLVAHLEDPASFKRLHRVPTLPADEPGYDPAGGYWRGSVWAPTTMMVVRGLEKQGFDELARTIALNHLDNVAAVFEDTGTIWENYAPDARKPGKPARKDFVGWTGLAPLLFLTEYAVGIKADGPGKRLVWNIRSGKRVGMKNLHFGGLFANLVCEAPDDSGKRAIRIEGDGEFTVDLVMGEKKETLRVEAGKPLVLER